MPQNKNSKNVLTNKVTLNLKLIIKNTNEISLAEKTPKYINCSINLFSVFVCSILFPQSR